MSTRDISKVLRRSAILSMWQHCDVKSQNCVHMLLKEFGVRVIAMFQCTTYVYKKYGWPIIW